MAGRYAIESVFNLIDKVSAPTSKIGRALDGLGIKSKAVSDRLKKDFDKAAARVDKLGKAAKKAAGAVAAVAGAAVTAFAASSVKNAMEYQTALAKVSTVADTTKMSLDNISSGILALSNKMGINANELSESMFAVISAGVDTADALSVVETTTKLTTVACIDSATAINTVTTVLNAYGKSADDAAKIANQMYIATTRGNASFTEMENAMKKVIPTAAALGVTTEEVFASVSVLTSMGERTNVSMSLLGDAIEKIARPSKAASDVARQLGIDFSEAALQSKGFNGVMKEIAQKTGGNARALEALFGNVDIARIIGKLSVEGSAAFDDTIAAMMDTDAVGVAFDKMMDTPEKRWANAMNKVRNSGIKLGTAILPIVEKIIEKISAAADRLSEIDFEKYTPAFERAFSVLESVFSAIVNVVNILWQFRGVIIAIAAPLLIYQGALMAITMITTAYHKIMVLVKVITAIATGGQLAYAIAIKKCAGAQLALTVATKETAIATKAWIVVMNAVKNPKQAFIGLVTAMKGGLLLLKGGLIAATVAVKGFTVALLTNPIFLIIAGVALLITRLVLLIKNWKKVTEAIKNNTEKVMPVITALLGPIGFVISAIKEVASNWGRIKNALGEAGLTDKIKEVAGSIKQFFQPIIDWLVNAFNKVKDTITGFFSGIANKLQDFFSPIIQNVQGFFRGVFDAVYNYVKPMLDWFGEKWTQIVSFFTDNAIGRAIKLIGATLLSGILAPIQGLLEILSYIPGLGHLAGKGAEKISQLRANLRGDDPVTEATAAPADIPLAANATGAPRNVNAPDFNSDVSFTTGTASTAGRSPLHGVVDVSGGASSFSLSNSMDGTRTATAAPASNSVIPEIVTRNIGEMVAILRRIDASALNITNRLPELTRETITHMSLPLPRINTSGGDESADNFSNPRAIAPVTQAERMAYNVEERINRLVIEVTAERGTSARVVRAPRDAEIELVSSGGNL